MKKFRSMMLVLIMTAVCSLTMVQTAFAAQLPSVSVPVEITLFGTLPSPAEDYVVKLEGEDSAYPMPEGAVNGVCSLTITGEGSAKFPDITFNRVGVYTYKIWQEAGSNPDCTYDSTVYTLTVYITNAENGDGLEATAVLYPDAESSKQAGAEFVNRYKVKYDPTTPTKPATPTKHTKTPGASRTSAPKTGDASNLQLLTVLFGVSAGVLAILFLSRRRGKNEE